jgi:signal peptidase I
MKNLLRENRGLILFLVLFGLFRTAVADWNPIPSGSMRPTLIEGDVVLVNRLAYDLKVPLTDVSLAPQGEPQRGDIVTFRSPATGDRLIKRLVALPGDVVELRDEVLYVNGSAASYTSFERVTEALPDGRTLQALRATEEIGGDTRRVQFLPVVARRTFGPATVPAGHYFMLGDNRDNSADSRYIGFVPRSALIGRAGWVLVSADILGRWQPQFQRFGLALD